MKYEWKKQEKDLYGAKKTPSMITVPKQRYIMISGKGNPNDEDFSNRVASLYALAYAIKMGFKATAVHTLAMNEIHDFAVYPLEGVWKQKQGDELVKEELEYTIMIRQPDFITADMVSKALETVKRKKPIPFMKNCALIRCKMANVLKSCILERLMMRPLLLKKWCSLQRKMV